MTISGNFETMELSELLQWVAQGHRTGALVLESGEILKRIYFEDGRIIASSSNQESEQLGYFLVSHGYVTQPELDKAVAIQEETGMLLGKILVTIGAITEEELLDLLVLKTEESIYSVFTWNEGVFRFAEDETLDRGLIPMALDVTAITLQGMNRLDEWSRIRRTIPNSDAVPVVVGDFEGLPDSERKILDRIDDQRSVGDICKATRTSEFRVSKLIHREVQEGRVKVVAVRPVIVEKQVPGPSPEPIIEIREVEVPVEVPAEAAPPLKITGRALCDQGMTHLQEGRLDEGLRHLRAAKLLEPRNTSLQEDVRKGEDQIRRNIQANGLDDQTIPILERNLEELTDLSLTPEEGFLLTRIDGSHSVNEILKLSPLERLEGELVFYKLMRDGHVRLQPKG